MEPAPAGLVLELTLKSSFSAAICPAPLKFTVNSPGTAGHTGSVNPPAPSTETTALGALTSNGTTALIWLASAYRIGAERPSKVTLGFGGKVVPNSVTISPAATAPSGAAGVPPGARLAAFTSDETCDAACR